MESHYDDGTSMGFAGSVISLLLWTLSQLIDYTFAFFLLERRMSVVCMNFLIIAPMWSLALR